MVIEKETREGTGITLRTFPTTGLKSHNFPLLPPVIQANLINNENFKLVVLARFEFFRQGQPVMRHSFVRLSAAK